MTIILHEIINLCNVAKHHKRICNESTCDVSLNLIKHTVDRLYNSLSNFEQADALKFIEKVEWY